MITESKEAPTFETQPEKTSAPPIEEHDAIKSKIMALTNVSSSTSEFILKALLAAQAKEQSGAQETVEEEVEEEIQAYQLNPADIIKEEEFEESMGEPSHRNVRSKLSNKVTFRKASPKVEKPVEAKKEVQTPVENKPKAVAEKVKQPKPIERKKPTPLPIERKAKAEEKREALNSTPSISSEQSSVMVKEKVYVKPKPKSPTVAETPGLL